MPRNRKISDDREQISSNAFPYNAIYCIMGKDSGMQWMGTAFAISPHILLTAAHNLVNKRFSGRAKQIEVWGHRGGRVPGYRLEVESFRINERFLSKQEATTDYGLVFLKKPLPINQFFRISPETTGRRTVETAGFPGDKMADHDITLWGSKFRMRNTDQQMQLDTYLAIGQSGSPVFVWDSEEAIAVGLIHKAIQPRGIYQYGVATPVTGRMIQDIGQWSKDARRPLN